MNLRKAEVTRWRQHEGTLLLCDLTILKEVSVKIICHPIPAQPKRRFKYLIRILLRFVFSCHYIRRFRRRKTFPSSFCSGGRQFECHKLLLRLLFSLVCLRAFIWKIILESPLRLKAFRFISNSKNKVAWNIYQPSGVYIYLSIYIERKQIKSKCSEISISKGGKYAHAVAFNNAPQ